MILEFRFLPKPLTENKLRYRLTVKNYEFNFENNMYLHGTELQNC